MSLGVAVAGLHESRRPSTIAPVNMRVEVALRSPAPVAYKADKRARMVSWLSGSGIEIGALHNPLSLPAGAEVRYVDRLREDELRRHYPELAHLDLAPVSVTGDAQDLSALEADSVDFVVANHLLEHLEDPLRGLCEMHRVLRFGGILYVALPDPRATFDRDRPLTSVEHLLTEFRRGASINRRAHYEEWVDLVEPVLGDWDHLLTGSNMDREGQIRMLTEMSYSIHFHVWRPETFLEFLGAAKRECELDYELLAFEPCWGEGDDEFILVLLKGSSLASYSSPPGREIAAPQPERTAKRRTARAELVRLAHRATSELRASGLHGLARLVIRRLRRPTGTTPRHP